MIIQSGSDMTRITQLVQGNSLTFTVFRAAYLATLWTMKFILSKDGSVVSSFDASASGTSFSVTLTSAQSLTIKTGRCQVALVFTNISDPTQRASEYVGILTVTPNPGGTLVQTVEMVALAKVKSAISIIVSQPEQSASFNGQSYQLHNIDQLYVIRDRLQVEVDNQMRELGIIRRAGGARTILTRFR